MKYETFYAIHCNKKDEKLLMQRVNGYLAELKRTTSKTKSPSLLKRYLPRVIKHFYWNLNKDTQTWFDIFPNEDVNGDYCFPDYKECGWMLRVLIHDTKVRTPASTEKAEQFIAHLLGSIEFQTTMVRESDDERLSQN